jgi:salicylate hydroxylase
MGESLHLIVISAGLCGLAAAVATKVATKVANPDHHVTILESVKELAEIGVSI